MTAQASVPHESARSFADGSKLRSRPGLRRVGD